MQSPFKFLDAYNKNDREIFFGREMEVEILYEMTFETNLILLYGASGTGKTSLINCGLSNKFQDTDWFSMFIRRGNHIIRSLEKEIRKNSVTEIAQDVSIPKALKSLFYDHYKPLYLIFDQFEELFILGDEEEQRAFFDTLNKILGMELQATIILSMREEYIAWLSDYEKVVPALFDNRLRLEKMNRSNLEQVILGTANAFDIGVAEPEITVDRILTNLSNKRSGIDLTNLQVYLDRLYREHGGDTVIFDPVLIDKVGPLEDVMADFLREQLSSLGQDMGRPELPLTVLYTLVTDNGTKRSLDLEGIRSTLSTEVDISDQELKDCLRRFEEIRILKAIEEG